MMKHDVDYKLNFAQKLLLNVAGIAAAVGVATSFNAIEMRAQSPSTPLAFEVASVKRHKPGAPQRFEFLPGGRVTIAGAPLLVIVSLAYNLPFQTGQLSGGPGWIRSNDDTYDIDAKPDERAMQGLSARTRADQMRVMLQTLLAERFKLAIRRETKNLPVYTLGVGKNGAKLQKSKFEEKDCSEDSGDNAAQCHQAQGGQGRGIHSKAIDMSDLVLLIGNFTDRPLVDRTGIKGLYDIDTEGWVPLRFRPTPQGAEPTAENSALSDTGRPTLFMIFDRLGLKMESSRAPVEMFVIEHVEKPSEN